MPPLVSIIIPCHNAAPWLAETLASALAQTWPQKEIIVVDDGSTDDSAAVVRGFAPRGVRLVSQPNAGAAAARNRGWREARGDFLQFLDADDLLAPDKIARQVEAAAAGGADCAYSAAWHRFTRTPAEADQTPQPLCADLDPLEFALRKFERNAMMHPAAWLVPRPLAERAGPWDEALSLDDDGEYFLRVVLAARAVRYVPDAVSYYRSGLAGSLSGSKSEAAYASAYRSLDLSTRRVLARADTPRARRACATALQLFIYESYPRAAACRRAAAARVAALGGSDLPPPGGPKFRLACRLLGWRLAKRLALLR
ncbi:MAG: glycosyltransferase [Opitutaceae bacterium]|nr:glycosyltransferase [Opitutaceae bacterium]